MTIVATIVLPEGAARNLAEAIADDDRFADVGLDLNEAAPGRWRVALYFERAPTRAERGALTRVVQTVAKTRGAGFTEETLRETNWVAKSLAGLAPVRAGRFLIHGRHDRALVRANDIGIEIEAGLAFGTGHHATTAGCLIAIDRTVKRCPIRNALDLGTGSGVLAIAIAKRTKASVVASDIDPVAVDVAHANARLNGVAARVRTVTADGLGHRLIRVEAPYDLIAANILAGPLVALAPAIRRHLARRGVVILSGLLVEQCRRVSAAYRGQGLHLAGTIILDGWATLIVEG